MNNCDFPQGSARAPNLLFVMVDELRFPTVFPLGIENAAGFFAAFMPNVYQLWQRGVKFTAHMANANACTPARGTLLTGLYSQQTWLCETLTSKTGAPLGPQPALDPAFPTWGSLLRREGFETAWCGKWHVSYPQPGIGGIEAYGFDQLVFPDPIGFNLQGTYGEPDAGYLNDADITGAASSWLCKRRAGDRPWCLAVSFVNPHDKEAFWAGTEFKTYNDLFDAQSTYQPVTPYSYNDGKTYPPVVPWSEDALRDPPSYGYPVTAPNWQPETALASKPPCQTAWRNFTSATWGGVTDISDVADFTIQPYPGDAATGIGIAPFSYWQRSLDAYTWLCNRVDAQIGAVIAALPDEVAADTIIVFTSDHGDYAGAHGFVSGKMGTCYDEAFHVPLIVVDPTGRHARDIETPRTGLSSSVDMLRLIMGLATGGDGWMQGELATLYGARLDMMAMLRSAQAPGRPWLVFATDEMIPRKYNPDGVPLHVTGLRTVSGKLGLYAGWQKGTAALDPATVAIEYYDYATEDGRLETVSTSNDRRASQLAARLQGEIIPNELRQPLPSSLTAAGRRAKGKLIGYCDLIGGGDEATVKAFLAGLSSF